MYYAGSWTRAHSITGPARVACGPRSTEYRVQSGVAVAQKTVLGLTTHVILAMTCHTLKHLLRRFFGIDVQTYTAVHPV